MASKPRAKAKSALRRKTRSARLSSKRDEDVEQNVDEEQNFVIAKLWAEMTSLRETVHTAMRLAEMNTIENALSNTMGEISTFLGPLQELKNLTPKRTPLEGKAAALLESLRVALQRADWNSLSALPGGGSALRTPPQHAAWR